MIFLYKCFLQIVHLLSPLMRLLPHQKIQYYFQHQGKIRFLKGQNFSERPIWIHTSSGELEYARPVIRSLRAHYPQVPLLVTHTSLSSRKALESLPVTAIGVSPLDVHSEVEKFLETCHPRACLIARTDLWPQMLENLKRHHIPAFLFSATFSDGLQKTSWASRQILRPALQRLQKIYFVSSQDADSCLHFYPGVTGDILGDTRYDQVFFRLETATQLHLPRYDQLLIAGSTWPEDEEVLLPAAEKLKAHGFKWIWVPHENHEADLQKLEISLAEKKIRSLRFSQIPDDFSWLSVDVLIVDKVGLLASLYPFAQVAFVGGSFRKQVHSVMEALAAGCPTLVGPYHHNNREALEFKNLGFVKETQDSEQIVLAILEYHRNHKFLSQELKKQMIARCGTTEKLIRSLEDQGLFAENESPEFRTS